MPTLLPVSVWWRHRRRRRRRAPTTANHHTQYSGHILFRGEAIPRIPLDELEPRAFFERFVAARRPVIICGLLPELGRLGDDELERAAGDCDVDVEVRDGERDAFGKGRKQRMRFGELLEHLRRGSTRYYLTTQPLPDEALVAPPLSRLGAGLPLRPALLPTLEPQTINLWLGRAKAGASSGLHHDYHDNLYCLLRGAKRFRLFSPDSAPHMHTHGTLARVHPNGRINYVGAPTAADGRTAEDDLRFAARRARATQRRAERALEAAETAEASGSGTAAAVAAAEEDLDEAMDAAVGAASDLRRCARRERAAAAAAAPDAPPDSFSRADLSRPPEEVRARWPRIARACEASCEVNAGEMLYLPCGWFHDVTSFGAHCAVNYWFQPPDRRDFRRPYTAAAFWRDEGRRKRRRVA